MNILLILPGFILAIAIIVIYEIKIRKPQNNIHFYVARDSDPFNEGSLDLWINKPVRGIYIWYAEKSGAILIAEESDFELFGLNPSDYDNLKWEDEPVEVFLTLK